jgi:hypothetical protein
MTFNAVRRLAALDALQRLGVALSGYGCPMDYETSVGGARSRNEAKAPG